MKQILLLLYLFFSTIAVNASIIKGVVRDSVNREPVIGALVQLKNTTLGDYTNLDGSYVINNVPSGVYNVITSCLGYTKREFQINISDQKVIVLNYAT